MSGRSLVAEIAEATMGFGLALAAGGSDSVRVGSAAVVAADVLQHALRKIRSGEWTFAAGDAQAAASAEFAGVDERVAERLAEDLALLDPTRV